LKLAEAKVRESKLLNVEYEGIQVVRARDLQQLKGKEFLITEKKKAAEKLNPFTTTGRFTGQKVIRPITPVAGKPAISHYLL